jgi:hypothetical protein
LFVDASDRSEAFTIRFEHVCNERKFLAHMSDTWEKDDDVVPAEFEISGHKAVRMGIQLEEELEQYIWFDKVSGAGSRDQVVMGVE